MPNWLLLLLLCVFGIQTQDLPLDKNGKPIQWWHRWDSLSPKEKIYYGHNLKGNKFYERGDFAAALAEYNEMIRLAPNFPDGYNMRAMLYHRTEQYDKSISDWNRMIALEVRPEGKGIGCYNRALNYRMKHDWDRGIE